MATPMRYFRCPDPLWVAAQELARERGTNVTRELIRFLELYTGVQADAESDDQP